MRLRRGCFLVSAALAYGSGWAAEPAIPSSDALKAEVIAAYDASVAAAESLNLDALDQALAENNDGALIVNGRLLLSRPEVVEFTRGNFSRIAALKYAVGPRRLTLLSPTSALLVTNGTVSVETTDGRSFTRTFAHTIVYVRIDGKWRVWHSHQSNPPRETEAATR